MEYTSNMRNLARILNESTDRITLDELPINSPDCTRHATIALEGSGCVQLWTTSYLHSWIIENNSHPLLGRRLHPAERSYIEHYNRCLEIDNEITDERNIYRYFINTEGRLPESELLKARALLEPSHFASHFKDYKPLENDLRYERTQAEGYLQRTSVGSWVLRHSSLNRSIAPYDTLIQKLGLQYYVLSFTKNVSKQKMVKHILILHRPGWGWARIKNVAYTTTTVEPIFGDEEKYHVCFTDILLEIIRGTGLLFQNQIYGYM